MSTVTETSPTVRSTPLNDSTGDTFHKTIWEHSGELFTESAITPDVAEARGYKTLYGTDEDLTLLSELGFKPYQYNRSEAFPALLIPWHRATGEIISHQLKPAEDGRRTDTRGKRIKYETPGGSQTHIDVPPYTRERLSDLNKPLWITEGIKKVDSLVSHGVAALGISGVFNWRNKTGSLGDWEDIPLKDRQVVVCFDSDTKTNRNVQLAMRRFGRWLESKGVAKVHYLIVPADVDGTPVKGVDDFFAAGGAVTQLRQASTEQAPTEGPKDDAFTEYRLAERAAEEVLEGRFRFVLGLGWIEWTGSVWKETNVKIPRDAVGVWAKAQLASALESQAKDIKQGADVKDASRTLQEQISGWRSVLNLPRLSNILELASGMRDGDGQADIYTNVNQLDQDSEFLNCKNGVIDLRTGDLMPHDPGLLMTKMADAEYEPGYEHPDWNKALTALPEDVRGWYQVRIGQAATGDMTPDDLLVIAHGDGENGKSAIKEGVERALGSYAYQISDRVLMANPDAHPTELMDLQGVRYAVLEETSEARHLDTHRLKKVVGTEKITARRIRQDSVSFKATHSLFINTNYRPVVSETDHGTWRRLALLPFPYTYRKPGEPLLTEWDRRGDPTIKARIKSSPEAAKAVLAWIVRGAVRFYNECEEVMPELPASVRDATFEWRKGSDAILGFVSDYLVFDSESHIPVKDMYGTFLEWLDAQGLSKWTDKTFSSRFSSHDSVKRARVGKMNLRSKKGLSRPEGQADMFEGFRTDDLGVGYKRWEGVRFRTEADETSSATGATAESETPTRDTEPGVNRTTGCTGCAPAPSPADHPGFKTWLVSRGPSSPLGKLYRDVTDDPGFPDSSDLDECTSYLEDVSCSDSFLSKFLSCWSEYQSHSR